MNVKLSLGCAMVLVSYISTASAEDCGALKEQARQATGQQKVELWQQSINECPSSNLMYLHYQHGLALITTGNFDEALNAFKKADNNGVGNDRNYYTTKIAVLGRQAQMHLKLEQRVEALAALKSASKLAKEEQITIPDWLLAVQKYNDDAITNKPFTAAEINRLLATTKAFGVEPALDYQITFEFDSATMTPEGKALLQKVIESLQGITTSLSVVGHTDTKGDANYNQTLSEKRAIAIKNALVAKIPSLANQLTPLGKGESEPKYNSGTSDDDQRNRRVEFVFAVK
ncbi:MAG: OmpA family protein [Moraxellaceae bacterium]|nr:OmpA family protein [Moraxellaceae bacterium]